MGPFWGHMDSFPNISIFVMFFPKNSWDHPLPTPLNIAVRYFTNALQRVIPDGGCTRGSYMAHMTWHRITLKGSHPVRKTDHSLGRGGACRRRRVREEGGTFSHAINTNSRPVGVPR